MAMLRWWVALTSRREDPLSQALVRVLLAAVILADWVQIGRLGLVEALFAPESMGGMGRPLHREPASWMYQLLPPEHVAVLGYGAVIVLTVMVGLGLLTRLSAGALVLVMAQLALALPAADRGIDMLIRNMLVLLVFAHSHRALSLDAWFKSGRLTGDGEEVPAWPRYLVVMQLVILYFTAGMQKVATSWTPLGDFSALYIAMRDPAFAVFSPELLATLFPLTQALTASSVLWEWLAPGLLLALLFRDTRLKGGWLRAAFNRLRFRDAYLLIGLSFHFGTAISLQLGIFPWAVIALYPACFHPDEVRSLLRSHRDR
jgi:vitamin K-dependent gamma-carboxylase